MYVWVLLIANDMNGLVMHHKAINKWGKQKYILKKIEDLFFL